MRKKCFLIIVAVTLFRVMLFGNEYWEEIYSAEEILGDVVLNSSKDIFLGTQSGVYKSFDDGVSWDQKLDINTHNLVIDSNGVLFATRWNIYYSQNNGEDWSQIEYPNLMSFSARLFFTISGDMLYYSNGIFKTSNHGETWTKVLDCGVDGECIYEIVETSQGVLFAGSTDFLAIGIPGGVYRSTD
ncbi:MAG: hypothetical protein JXR48_03715, partial [Candidatus Delongbacteria bacterium]|nr:hypothetical protein [Candidatus Delongbacteria bacterium]MBN2834054.1 hypothetical protein [Candidatus Delongbacteria bacterium]